MALLLPHQVNLRTSRTSHISFTASFLEKLISDKNCAVLWSGGKDSTVAMMMAREVKKDIPVYFIDDHEMSETYSYIKRMQKLFNLNLRVIYQHGVLLGGDTYIYFKDLSPKSLAKRASVDFPTFRHDKRLQNVFYWTITKTLPYHEQIDEDVVITGMRADEDIQRRFLSYMEKRERNTNLIANLIKHGAVKDKGTAYASHPLLDWTEHDVHEYLDLNKIPKNPLYSKGYRSIGDRFTTTKSTTSERGGRSQDLEMMLYMASLGYFQSVNK